MSTPRSALVFGARNLGRSVVERLLADGWSVTTVARTEATLEPLAAAGAQVMTGDITDATSVTEALQATGGVDLVVNAASPYGGDRSGPFGGGPLADARPEAFDAWATRPAQAAFTFLSASARFALDAGRPATLVQITGGSARRAMPGRGLWAAGCFGVRALTLAAAQELRGQGIHVALLIVDAGIEPYGGGRGGGPELADPREIADAVVFLAEQGARSNTHELQLTPLAESWTP